MLLTLAITFGIGFAFNEVISTTTKENSKMKKVTGIGGIFFKCKDPNIIKEWYKTHLGLDTDQYGTNFEWRQGADIVPPGPPASRSPGDP